MSSGQNKDPSTPPSALAKISSDSLKSSFVHLLVFIVDIFGLDDPT
jgi:hypothetical protein